MRVKFDGIKQADIKCCAEPSLSPGGSEEMKTVRKYEEYVQVEEDEEMKQ